MSVSFCSGPTGAHIRLLDSSDGGMGVDDDSFVKVETMSGVRVSGYVKRKYVNLQVPRAAVIRSVFKDRHIGLRSAPDEHAFLQPKVRLDNGTLVRVLARLPIDLPGGEGYAHIETIGLAPTTGYCKVKHLIPAVEVPRAQSAACIQTVEFQLPKIDLRFEPYENSWIRPLLALPHGTRVSILAFPMVQPGESEYVCVEFADSHHEGSCRGYVKRKYCVLDSAALLGTPRNCAVPANSMFIRL